MNRNNIGDELNAQDCNDNDNTVFPGATKLCDGQVNDVDADTGTCGTALSASDGDEASRARERFRPLFGSRTASPVWVADLGRGLPYMVPDNDARREVVHPRDGRHGHG